MPAVDWRGQRQWWQRGWIFVDARGRKIAEGESGDGVASLDGLVGSASVGILGGGRPKNSETLETDSSVDPTPFYRHLTAYTANATTESKYPAASIYIDTASIGYAANVFRCLINALEYSTGNEIVRLEKALEILEIDSWNDEGKEVEGGGEEGGVGFRRHRRRDVVENLAGEPTIRRAA